MSKLEKRDSNLDLLRIVSMLLIVLIHSIDHSGVLEQAEVSSGAMYAYVRFTYALCQVCVNCYVMLSGYYLVNSKFHLKKLLTLWMEIAFYSFFLKLLFMILGLQRFSFVSLASCLLPVLSGRYWFITIYVGLYLVFPFLNKLIHAMSRTEHLTLNLCLFALFSLWISIFPGFAGMNSGGGWGLAWFVVLYLAAAWFRLYYTPKHSARTLIGAYIAIALLMTAALCVANRMGFGILQQLASKQYRYDSVPVYLMTVALFVAFLNIRIKNAKVEKAACAVAPLTLGVYLIHAHANIFPWLWETLDLPRYMDQPWFPLLQMGCVFAIFLICIGIDAVRRATVGKLERANVLQRFCNAVTERAKKALERF